MIIASITFAVLRLAESQTCMGACVPGAAVYPDKILFSSAAVIYTQTAHLSSREKHGYHLSVVC